MSQEQLLEQCSGMSDIELVKSVTRNKSTYSDEFHTVARLELTRRGIDLEEFTRTAWFSLDGVHGEPLTIEDAIGRLDRPMTIWDIGHFRSALGERIAVQRDGTLHEAHCFDGDDYFASFTAPNAETLKEILRAFLRLEDWEEKIEQRYDLADWQVLEQTSDRAQIESIAAVLSAAGIPFTIRSSAFLSCSAIFGTSHHAGAIMVLVSDDQLVAGQAALGAARQRIDALYEEAAELAEQGRSTQELEAYRQLAGLVPHDADVALRYGIMLAELDRHAEAAEALMRAVTFGDADVIEETRPHLVSVAQSQPENLPLLYTLASLFMGEQNSEAERYYRKILAISSEDPIAHLNLGHIFYQEETDDSIARRHFEKYLELYPGADDREAIELIMAELG